MNNTQQFEKSKANYEIPTMNLIRFSCADMITASENGDENQGEWDPQND